MRRHVACSGCLPGACSSLAGKRRAGAPGETEAAARSPLHSTGSGAAPPPWRHRFCNPCGETGASQPQKRRPHSTPARSRRFVRFFAFVPPPMRRHVGCSGCLPGARSSRAGNRRAGAPAKPCAMIDLREAVSVRPHVKRG
jgi:hypothetical protein